MDALREIDLNLPTIVTPNPRPKLMTADDFKGRDWRTHIYKTPDAFAGSDKWAPRKEWIADFTGRDPVTPATGGAPESSELPNLVDELSTVDKELRIILADVTTPHVIVQLLVELLGNAADNLDRSHRESIPIHPPGKAAIECHINRQWVTVRNYGEPIPIETKEYEYEGQSFKIWLPQYILTVLLTSSNYDGSKTRHGIGKNGFGAKLVSIFSKKVFVQIIDGYRGMKYTQVIANNLLDIQPPKIEEVEIGTESSSTIAYLLDFERFGIDPNIGYPDETLAIFASRVIGTSFTTKAPTSLNGREFKYFHIKDYGRLIFGEFVDTAVVHYELANPETEEIRMKKINGIMTPIPVLKDGERPSRNVVPDTEILIIDAAYYPGPKVIMSFANSMQTIKGGIHVKKFYDVVVPPILNKINDVEPKVDLRKLKGKALRVAAAKRERAKKKAQTTKGDPPKRLLKPNDVRPFIAGIINCRVDDPSYSSQIKDELSFPDPKLATLTQSEIKHIYEWDLMDKLKSHLRAIKMYILTKTDGKKAKNLRIKNGFNAHLAGTDRSKECVLWIVEGKSALAYAVSLLSLIPNGREKIGVVAVRGKFINALKAEPERLVGSKEVALLKQVLGLQEGKKYNIQENFEELNYGNVMLMTDADYDGSHIKGLLCNFFYAFYPELLEIGYILDYRTKFLKATRGKETFKFYTHYQFEEWKKATPDWNAEKANGERVWKYDYFKGLGTAEDKDVEEDKANPKTVQFVCDQYAFHMFNVAFGKQTADVRKEWVRLIRELKNPEYFLKPKLEFTTFFNREFIEYIMASLQRAIPNASDGLKRVHRQIIHAMTKHWTNANPSGGYKKFKVAQFAGYIAEHVEYQHNEDCISKAIIILARNFPGSNNLQLLMDRGQYGSRMFGGDDHSAPRYIHTNPSKYFYLIFRKEDLPILDYLEDDGVKVEPKAYFPIIPMGLVNGVQGVATAYSTTIMNYNPIEIIDWLLVYLYNAFFSADKPKKIIHPLIPWYKGFKGKITLVRDCIQEEDDEHVIREYADVDDLTQPIDVEIPKDIGVDYVRADADAGTVIREADISDNTEAKVSEVNEVTGDTNKGIKFDKVIIEGVMENRDGKVHISEIPIGRWTINYGDFLYSLEKAKIIGGFRDGSVKDIIDIDIKGMERPSMRKLNLVRKISLSNMVFLDVDGVPVRYNLLEDYLEYFVKLRLQKYAQRREYQIRNLRDKIDKINMKVKLTRAIKSGKIIIGDRDLKDINQDMEAMGIDPKLLASISLQRTVREKVDERVTKRRTLKVQLKDYEKLTPPQIWYRELIELRKALMKDEDMIRKEPGYIMDFKQARTAFEPEEKKTKDSLEPEPPTSESTITTAAEAEPKPEIDPFNGVNDMY